ncbi:Lcmt2 [Symbiodinium sp. CCMP2456]|nr:Lcmt2 [Symbiodinium sp. CCMP2456]
MSESRRTEMGWVPHVQAPLISTAPVQPVGRQSMFHQPTQPPVLQPAQYMRPFSSDVAAVHARQRPIQDEATNDSSIVSKASAAASGYFEDPFVSCVAVRGPKGKLIRRSPLVHRCYYTRHLGVLQMQEAFLTSCIQPGEAYNVVVVGAGFDTGALRRSWPPGLQGYYEVEFPAVLTRKEALLRRANVELPAWLHRCGADLRDLADVESSLKAAGTDFEVPTLIIAEVVLAYMEPGEGDALAAWAAGRFSNCLFGMYEQIGPYDPFGRFMRRHFLQRQCPLRSLLARPDIEAQRARFCSFPRVDAADMTSILSATPSEELARISGLEPFDEYEEFHLKCTHYFCLAAMSGRCCNAKTIWPNAGKSPSRPALEVPVHKLHELGISRFGLTASYAAGHLVVCGGHGTYDSSVSQTHGRQTSVLCRKLDPTGSLSPQGKVSQPFQHLGDHKAAMYCSATAVGSKVLLFGGRLGPHQPTNSLAVLETSERNEHAGCNPRLEAVDIVAGPAARWRHSATHVRIGSRDVLVVLGGRGTDAKTFSLDEGWLLDCDQLSWKCCPIFPTDGALPCARHSHAAAAIASQGLLMICGGLDANEELLGDAWILQRDDDRDSFAWRRSTSPLPRPRYGHHLHVFRGFHIVVGGIEWTYETAPICCNGVPMNVHHDEEDKEDDFFMWHNIATVMLHSTAQVLILGGGGNCFSFGTQLNPTAAWQGEINSAAGTHLAAVQCDCSRGNPKCSKPVVLQLEVYARVLGDLRSNTSLGQGNVLDMQEVMAAVETLYVDELKPYGRILRKRLAERASAAGQGNVDVDIKRLRSVCEACPWIYVQAEDGGDWSALLRGRPPNFIDVYSPQDFYPTSLWQAAASYFEGLDDANMVLPGGRYSCAQALVSRGLQFLQGRTLGQVCHIVQLAISQKKLLGYLNGAVVPYGRSQSMIKERCAERQKPCTNIARGNGSDLADWEVVKRGLKEILGSLSPGTATIPLSNVKRLFRSRFHIELSETALGHSKLSELLQDPRLRDICSVRLQGHGYVVSPVTLSAVVPSKSNLRQAKAVQMSSGPGLSVAAAGAAAVTAAVAAACGQMPAQAGQLAPALGVSMRKTAAAPSPYDKAEVPFFDPQVPPSAPTCSRAVGPASVPAVQHPTSRVSLRDRAPFVAPLSMEDVEQSPAVGQGQRAQSAQQISGTWQTPFDSMPLMTSTPSASHHRRTESVPRNLGSEKSARDSCAVGIEETPGLAGLCADGQLPAVPATPETLSFPQWPMLTPNTLDGMGYSVQNTFINFAVPSTPMTNTRSHSLPRNMGASGSEEAQTGEKAEETGCGAHGPANRLMSAAAAACCDPTRAYVPRRAANTPRSGLKARAALACNPEPELPGCVSIAAAAARDFRSHAPPGRPPLRAWGVGSVSAVFHPQHVTFPRPRGTTGMSDSDGALTRTAVAIVHEIHTSARIRFEEQVSQVSSPQAQRRPASSEQQSRA